MQPEKDRPRHLSFSDRVGIIVATLGGVIGLSAAFAFDLNVPHGIRAGGLRGILFVLVFFPGVLIASLVGFLPMAASIKRDIYTATCALLNGAAYGFLLFGWMRMMNALRYRISMWSSHGGGKRSWCAGPLIS